LELKFRYYLMTVCIETFFLQITTIVGEEKEIFLPVEIKRE